MTETASTDAVAYPGLPDESPMGAPLDWAWLRGAQSEWGVQPKPSPRGLTMMDIAIGTYGEVPEHPGAPLHGAPRLRRRHRHAGHGLHPQRQDRRVGRQRAWSCTRRPSPASGRPPATSPGASSRSCRRPRARHVPAVHGADRGRDDRRRPAGQVDVADEPRLHRSEDVPLHPDHGRGPPRRGVPQAGPGQRRRAAAVPLRADEPAAHDHRGQDLHAGHGADAPARRGLRARHLPAWAS